MPAAPAAIVSVKASSESDAKYPSSSESQYIYVADNFRAKEGAKLTDNLFIGKPLGVGLQGGVFLLQKADGSVDPDQVLKVVFKFGIGGLFGMTNLEREWRVGRHLALLTEPGEALPGFMGTGAGIVTKSGKFRAMILERIVGRDVSKPISSKKFHDIHYLRQMLFCVFSGLHQAQKKLAFHHADLRLPNIMEVVPDAHTIAASTTDPPRAGNIQEAAQFEAEHIPTASGLTGNLSSATPSDARMRPLTGTQSGVGLMGSHGDGHSSIKTYSSDLAGLQTAASRAAHFKMIDFGLADFRETFGAGYVAGKRGKLIHNEPHRAQPLYSLNAKGIKEQPGGRYSPGGHLRQKAPSRSSKFKFLPMPTGLLPEVPLMERIYRSFWYRKGDVFALLWDMQRYIDGRVWPQEDELEVRLLMDFMFHVTGVHVRAWFAPSDKLDAKKSQVLRRNWRFSSCGILYRNEGPLHVLRIRSLRIRSLLSPANPGITAAEALQAPFFTFDQDN
ncbi:hypothetical protein WJX77_007974 [Trebouxia sp. C0004]